MCVCVCVCVVVCAHGLWNTLCRCTKKSKLRVICLSSSTMLEMWSTRFVPYTCTRTHTRLQHIRQRVLTLSFFEPDLRWTTSWIRTRTWFGRISSSLGKAGAKTPESTLLLLQRARSLSHAFLSSFLSFSLSLSLSSCHVSA